MADTKDNPQFPMPGPGPSDPQGTKDPGKRSTLWETPAVVSPQPQPQPAFGTMQNPAQQPAFPMPQFPMPGQQPPAAPAFQVPPLSNPAIQYVPPVASPVPADYGAPAPPQAVPPPFAMASAALEGRFRFTAADLIGSGGMAEVYRAHDTKLGRNVALKRLNAHAVNSAELIARFYNEARTVAQINHPHIVQVYDQIEAQDGIYIVMEFMDAGDLDSRINREGPLKPVEAVDMAIDLCEALQAVHDRKIYHRDVKPQNVLLNKFGHAKLTDFGIAHIEAGHMSLTQSAIAMGTPRYMAPEQERGAKFADGRSDIFSMGAMLYRMVTGLEPVAIRGDKIPEPIRDLLLKCVEIEMDKRYQACSDLIADLKRAKRKLERVESQTNLPVVPPQASVPAARPEPSLAPHAQPAPRPAQPMAPMEAADADDDFDLPKRNNTLYIGLGAGALILLAVAGYALKRPPPAPPPLPVVKFQPSFPNLPPRPAPTPEDTAKAGEALAGAAQKLAAAEALAPEKRADLLVSVKSLQMKAYNLDPGAKGLATLAERLGALPEISEHRAQLLAQGRVAIEAKKWQEVKDLYRDLELINPADPATRYILDYTSQAQP